MVFKVNRLQCDTLKHLLFELLRTNKKRLWKMKLLKSFWRPDSTIAELSSVEPATKGSLGAIFTEHINDIKKQIVLVLKTNAKLALLTDQVRSTPCTVSETENFHLKPISTE